MLDSRGSGVFYYVNVFLDDGNGRWRFAGEEFLGDRIKYDFIAIYGEGTVSSFTGVPIHPDDFGMHLAYRQEQKNVTGSSPPSNNSEV